MQANESTFDWKHVNIKILHLAQFKKIYSSFKNNKFSLGLLKYNTLLFKNINSP